MIAARKERIGWYFYDWANSAFTTSVITVFIGPYLTAIAKAAADTNGYVYPLGIPVYYGSLFGYVVSVSVFLQMFILPLIGSLVDSTHSKKLYLAIFAYIGSLATSLLFFLEGSNYLFGSVILIVANLCFGASVVVYNSMLNDVSTKETSDKISSIGWAFGYCGAAIALLLHLLLFSNAAKIGISESFAVRVALSSVGLWWAVFTVITLLLIKNKTKVNIVKSNLLSSSFTQLKDTIRHIKDQPKALRFLIAFLFYNDGVQAVITFAAVFGSMELKMEQSSLISAILMVQFIAFFGALIFGKLAKKLGTKQAIMLSLFIWVLSLVIAYKFVQNGTQFYYLAAVIALVLGGTQALSRSLFTRLIPENKEAEYFSFYEISDKGTSWLGTFIFSFSLQFTQSYRIAILSLIVFFIIGISLLWNFKEVD